MKKKRRDRPLSELGETPWCKAHGADWQCDGFVAVQKHQLCSAHYQRLKLGLDINTPIARKRRLPVTR